MRFLFHHHKPLSHSKGFDPKGVLSNATISALFDEPPRQEKGEKKKKK